MGAMDGAAGGVMGFLGTLATNQSRKHESARNRDFQEKMSNTAHQREVKDLSKAGLNPVLTATGGRGASTPVGAMAQLDNPVTNGLNAYYEGQRISNENRQTNEDVKLKKLDQGIKKIDTILKKAGVPIADAKYKALNALTDVLKNTDWSAPTLDDEHLLQKIIKAFATNESSLNVHNSETGEFKRGPTMRKMLGLLFDVVTTVVPAARATRIFKIFRKER